MSFRTHLILAFLGIILLLALGVLLAATRLAGRDKVDTIKLAEETVKKTEEADNRLAEQVLTRYGEFMVEDKASNVAKELAALLGGRKSYDYPRLRRDNRLREIAVQNIYALEGRAGYTILYDNNGENIFHPDRKVEGQNYKRWFRQYPEVWQAVEAAISHQKTAAYLTFFDQENRPRRRFTATVQVPGTPFIVAAVVNIDEFFLPTQERIKQASREVLAQARQTIVTQATVLQRQFEVAGLVILISLSVLGIIAAILVAGRLSRPLRDLAAYAKNLPGRDFSSQAVPESGVPRRYLQYNNEVGNMAKSLDFMEVALKQEIQELVAATAAKERIESELLIAREMQMSILPKIFPPFPHRLEFEIYAVIEPAKEVGGDFYDFFFLNERHFCFVIGDVADKGVPASLYMAVTKTLIKAVAEQGHPPGEILTRVNRELASGHAGVMFVTVFLGILDTVSGQGRYANGGHNPPLLFRSTGAADFLVPSGDPLVGALEGLSYRTAELVLAPGESLFLYTDGVTEACNPSGELFSEDRLRETLQGWQTATPQKAIEEVQTRIKAFAAGAPQADDIAMLMLRFQGKVKPRQEISATMIHHRDTENSGRG